MACIAPVLRPVAVGHHRGEFGGNRARWSWTSAPAPRFCDSPVQTLEARQAMAQGQRSATGLDSSEMAPP
jgi:hypothetical protein